MLDDAEEPLNEVTLAVEREVAFAFDCPIGLWRDDHVDDTRRQAVNEAVRVITLVAEQGLRLDKCHQRLGLRDIVNLAAGEAERQRIAQGIDDHVDLRGEPAARAADGLVEPLFLRAPALC